MVVIRLLSNLDPLVNDLKLREDSKVTKIDFLLSGCLSQLDKSSSNGKGAYRRK